MKRKILILTILLAVFTSTGFVIAEDTNKTDLEKKIAEYQNKLTDLRQQKNTLTSQIQYMDTQIYLTTLRIQETENKIDQTEKEINTLTTRIEGLDQSLDYLSKLLLNKIIEGYKKKTASLFDLLFDSANAGDLISRLKYLRTAQQNNQKLLVRVQETKLNFEEQKKLREEKKVELDKLISILGNQKTDLDNQKTAKQTLLEVTQNDENTYQKLLEKAKRELSAFTTFTQSIGGGLTTFGNGSNGWYYTQRDPQWGNLNIGSSPYLVWQAGCALTSVAMVCKSYGQSTTPSNIATNESNFIYGDLLNNKFACEGKSPHYDYDPPMDSVKNSVRDGPVILRLIAPSVSGLHFIVVWKWEDGDNDFIMHDPYNGPDLKFSSLYSWSQVTTAIAIR